MGHQQHKDTSPVSMRRARRELQLFKSPNGASCREMAKCEFSHSCGMKKTAENSPRRHSEVCLCLGCGMSLNTCRSTEFRLQTKSKILANHLMPLFPRCCLQINRLKFFFFLERHRERERQWGDVKGEREKGRVLSRLHAGHDLTTLRS